MIVSLATTSANATRVFVHSSVLAKSLCSEDIDVYEMEEAVTRVAASVEACQGFRVVVWFKPANDEENHVTSGSFSYHICSLMPVTALSDHQKSLMYGAPYSYTAGTSSSMMRPATDAAYYHSTSHTITLPPEEVASYSRPKNNREASSIPLKTTGKHPAVPPKTIGKHPAFPPEMIGKDPAVPHNTFWKHPLILTNVSIY